MMCESDIHNNPAKQIDENYDGKPKTEDWDMASYEQNMESQFR
jgi:hypothetical protein